MVNKRKNRGWSDKNILKCKTIGDRAGAYVWLCNTTSNSYEQRSKYIQFGIIAFTFIISIAGVPSIIWTDSADLLKISAGIIAGLVTLLGFIEGAMEWLGYPKSIKKHGWASSQYANQFMDIERTLSTDVKSRPRFSKFYAQIKKKEFSLQSKTPYIPPRIFKSYYKILGNQALRRELLFGDVNVIDVYVEDEKSTLAKDLPDSNEIHNEVKKSQSQRHKEYRKDFRKAKSTPRGSTSSRMSDTPRGDTHSEDELPQTNYDPNKYKSSMKKFKEFVVGNDSSGSDSDDESDDKEGYRIVKRIADRRRYELDRYFIEGNY